MAKSRKPKALHYTIFFATSALIWQAGCAPPEVHKDLYRRQPRHLADMTKGDSTDDDLIATADKVVDTTGWLGSATEPVCYEWTSWDGFFYYKAGSDGGKDVTMYHFDPKVSKAKPLDELTALLKKQGTGVGSLMPSPNLKMLLGQRKNPPQMFVSDDNGEIILTWKPAAEAERAMWTPESHVAVASIANGAAKSAIRDIDALDKPVALKPVALQPAPAASSVTVSRGGPQFFQLTLPDPKDASAKATIIAWDGKAGTQKAYDAFFGENRIVACKPAPDGKYLLWETTTLPVDGTATDKGACIRLFMTHWDGTSQRELGRIDLAKGKESDDLKSFSCMKWVPNGKFVSFLFRGSLWMIYI